MRDNYQRLVQPRLDEIRAWTAKCLTQAEIIAALGVGNDAYGRYKKKYADLRDAVSRGRAIADDAVVSAAYRRAVGYTVTEIREETGTTARDPLPVISRHNVIFQEIPERKNSGSSIVSRYNGKTITMYSYQAMSQSRLCHRGHDRRCLQHHPRRRLHYRRHLSNYQSLSPTLAYSSRVWLRRQTLTNLSMFNALGAIFPTKIGDLSTSYTLCVLCDVGLSVRSVRGPGRELIGFSMFVFALAPPPPRFRV